MYLLVRGSGESLRSRNIRRPLSKTKQTNKQTCKCSPCICTVTSLWLDANAVSSGEIWGLFQELAGWGSIEVGVEDSLLSQQLPYAGAGGDSSSHLATPDQLAGDSMHQTGGE